MFFRMFIGFLKFYVFGLILFFLSIWLFSDGSYGYFDVIDGEPITWKGNHLIGWLTIVIFSTYWAAFDHGCDEQFKFQQIEE